MLDYLFSHRLELDVFHVDLVFTGFLIFYMFISDHAM